MSVISEHLLIVPIIFPGQPVELRGVIDWLVVVQILRRHLRKISVPNHEKVGGMLLDLFVHVQMLEFSHIQIGVEGVEFGGFLVQDGEAE